MLVNNITGKSYCNRLALKRGCLLHGNLAISGMNVAAYAVDNDNLYDRYVDDAIDEHDWASVGLRKLETVMSNNLQASLNLSHMLVAMGIALPRFMLAAKMSRICCIKW